MTGHLKTEKPKLKTLVEDINGDKFWLLDIIEEEIDDNGLYHIYGVKSDGKRVNTICKKIKTSEGL